MTSLFSNFKTLYPRVPHSSYFDYSLAAKGPGRLSTTKGAAAKHLHVSKWRTRAGRVWYWIPGLCVLSRSTRDPTAEASSKLWVIFNLSNHKITNIQQFLPLLFLFSRGSFVKDKQLFMSCGPCGKQSSFWLSLLDSSPFHSYRLKQGWSWPCFVTKRPALLFKSCSYANSYFQA